MLKTRLLILGTLILLFIIGCSQNIEKEIVGTWQADEEKCDPVISDINREISFYDDNTVAGIEGYQEYKIENTNHEDYDYAVLSGGYEDVTKFRIKINKDDKLSIVKDEYEDDFGEVTSCEMEKTN